MAEAHRPRRVLVTGGAGFIGSGFVAHLLARDPTVEVLTLDALTYAGHPINLAGLPDPARHALVVGDIADAGKVAEVFEGFQPDTVVHFAAESHVDRSILDPAAFLRTNITGTYTLLEAARVAWGARSDVRFHHISTDEVYGSLSPDDPPRTEEHPYRPSSPYSASKAASDHLVEAWGRTHRLPVTLTLSCNIFGPRQLPEKLVPLVILRALDGEPLPIYGDGLQVREWLHVHELCEGVLDVVRRGLPGRRYNLSSARPITNLELVGRICGVLDRLRPTSAPRLELVRHVADRPGHDRRYALDCGLARRELGFAPARSLDEALEATIHWYLENPAWVAEVRQRSAHEAWMAQNYGARLDIP